MPDIFFQVLHVPEVCMPRIMSSNLEPGLHMPARTLLSDMMSTGLKMLEV